jgi:F0F1-type ATP synthase membrane subunit b/b'
MISESQLVTIRWFEDVRNLLENPQKSEDSKIIVKGPDTCVLHGQGYDFYCSDCQICLCAKCMDHSAHESHSFQKLDTVFRLRTELILEGIVNLQRRQADLNRLETQIQEHLDEMKDKKEEITQKLRGPVEKEVQRMNKLYTNEVSLATSKLNAVKKMLESINREALLEEKGLLDSSKSEFLKKFNILEEKYNKILSQALPQFQKSVVEFKRYIICMLDFSTTVFVTKLFLYFSAMFWNLQIL